MSKYAQQIELTRARSRQLMEEAADRIMTRPIPGLDPLSKVQSMLPRPETEDEEYARECLHRRV